LNPHRIATGRLRVSGPLPVLHRKLHGLFSAQEFASIEDLCRTLGVSEATTRRDVNYMETHGLVRRVHGGALSLLTRNETLDYGQLTTSCREEKMRIGRRPDGGPRRRVDGRGSRAESVQQKHSRGHEFDSDRAGFLGLQAQGQMIEVSRKVIIVADHTQFGRDRVVPVAPLSEIDVVVTDTGLPAEHRRWMRKAAVECIIA
jgi:DeoR/GlpR family transcriptional regulator of sugar metabolism